MHDDQSIDAENLAWVPITIAVPTAPQTTAMISIPLTPMVSIIQPPLSDPMMVATDRDMVM